MFRKDFIDQHGTCEEHAKVIQEMQRYLSRLSRQRRMDSIDLRTKYENET